ncbi:uncharacterized protein LOC116295380 [Actinia tenebrosa]|uniref:Uncharacterized protein LOC116295380 n=1 Tax=Actinia tenebrosa TaxID=6105 RepID=A0A6P8I2B1_ACTTE|nr:uncharacterized protein LOC116295380 [Actinia tenebrosa]
MKTIFIFLIFAVFSFHSVISAPINQVGLLDEKDVLKAPDDELLQRSKQHGISSLIDSLQQLGRLDEAVLKGKDNQLPAKRDPWRKSNKRWRKKKQKSSSGRKDVRVKETNSTTSTMEPTTTATPTAAAAHVSSVALTAPAVEGSRDKIPLSGCNTSGLFDCYNAYHNFG